ncbi:Protein aardvark [Symbiodinium microadriaticum]|uniref:Protein aardvark n=1 Tax=Symbiodinium microadriaticum TaxID=2951 RepID=A0A1Q9DS57_SYMMI|nr:Protein aardvark [Symbiodinium microadriaticum]
MAADEQGYVFKITREEALETMKMLEDPLYAREVVAYINAARAAAQFLADEEIQYSFCFAMSFSATRYPNIVLKAGGLPRILDAMKKFPKNIRLQAEACEALRNIAEMPDGADTLLSTTALEDVMNSMRMNAQAEWVVQEGCGLVCRMITESDDARDRLFKGEGLRIIMDCMEAFPRASWVALWGVQALRRFAELDAKRVQDAGAFDLVQRARTSKVFAKGCLAVRNATADCLKLQSRGCDNSAERFPALPKVPSRSRQTSVTSCPLESTPPAWWLKGQPRQVFRSRAEAELLSQLAVLLMPDEPIAEAFRDFPVKKCKDWGSSRLCPDFAAHGVLKATGAALFIEYDGYYRHMEPPGMARDMRKTSALLQFAPAGSVVLRIAHKERKWKDNSMQVLVDCWHSGNAHSLRRTLQQVVASLLRQCHAQLVPRLVSQLEVCAPLQIAQHARTFAEDAELVGAASENNLLTLQEFFQKEMQLSTVQVAKSIERFPSVLGLSIDANLKQKVEWLKGLGVSQSQVAKVIATHPQVLGLSIDANLKPTVEWIKGLGLSESQVTKVIATHPPLLCYSIHANLKPTVEWIRGLGLSQSQVDKLIAKRPQVLGLSIDTNLKPTVEWIKGLGLSQSQVVKLIAKAPQVLGLSIDANLKPTVEWIKGLGLSQSQVAKVIATHPAVLGYSIHANLKPTVKWVKGLGLSQSQVVKLIAKAPQVLGLSIDANLKPTVEWIKGLGLSQSQVAKVIATHPAVLGYSIHANLKPTVKWVKGLGLSQSQVVKLIAKAPQVLGLSIDANLKPTVEWIKGLGLSQSQVAKVIATHPAVLGYSIHANLKPTVKWVKGLGLSQSQVVKLIAKAPQVLGLSIDANLKPTVEWIKGLGLSQSQVAKVFATHPAVLGYSVDANLKPTVEWMKGLGLSQSQVTKVIATFPPVLGYSIHANLKPTVEWVKGLGLSQSQVAKVIAKHPPVLGYSIDANLKPTVEWIKGLGLSQSQAAKVIATHPQVLGYSIDANLKVKFDLVRKFFTHAAAAALLAKAPRLWSYRYSRLEHRLHVLSSQGQLSKLTGAMALRTDAFGRSVQKQANERLMEVKPLMVTDVKALGVLSADVRSELQFELCQPYLMRNGFYRVCQHVEPSVLKAIMVECINFTFYRAGEAAFEAGQTAKSAFFIERGTLEYQQNRRTSKVKRKLRVGAHNEIIIAEAALWTFWDYVGTLTAPNPASMLKLDVEKHTKIISESELMGEFAAELALHFRCLCD